MSAIGQPDELAEEDESGDDEVIDLEANKTSEEKRREREKEWGQQFDIWLIRNAKKERMVEVVLAHSIPGITKDNNVLSGIPKRVDRYMVQFEVGGQEVWVSKKWFISCRQLVAQKPTAESKTITDSPAE